MRTLPVRTHLRAGTLCAKYVSFRGHRLRGFFEHIGMERRMANTADRPLFTVVVAGLPNRERRWPKGRPR